MLPLPTNELGRLSIPEDEREPDELPLEDGGDGPNCRTVEEALEEYKRFMAKHNVPEKVRHNAPEKYYCTQVYGIHRLPHC